jgi:hypothetical protein
MRDWAVWYKLLVFAWIGIGVPGFILGLAYAGWTLSLPRSSVSAWLTWITAWLFLISPAVLWPLRARGGKQGFDD